MQLNLSDEALNYVLNVLAQRPYAECAPVINEIDMQMRAAAAARADQIAKERKAEIEAAVKAELKKEKPSEPQDQPA